MTYPLEEYFDKEQLEDLIPVLEYEIKHKLSSDNPIQHLVMERERNTLHKLIAVIEQSIIELNRGDNNNDVY